LTIINTYKDEGKSASKDVEKRTSFLKMIDDAKKGLFEVVLVYKLDRFSRNDYDIAMFRHELSLYNVKIVSATEYIPDTPEGELMAGMINSYASYFSKQLSGRVTQGMYQSALKGNALSLPPLGYDIKNKKYVINYPESAIVKGIFSLYNKNWKIAEIISYLNENGLKNKRGKSFVPTSFERILTNEKYIGIYSYKDVYIPDGVPRIISDEDFYKAKKRLGEKELRKHTQKISYPLSGKLFCKECGSRMVGKSAKGGEYAYYTCLKCGLSYSKTRLEKQILDLIKSFLTDDFIVKTSQMVVEYQNKLVADNVEVKELKKEYQEKTRLFENMKVLMKKDPIAFELYKDDVLPSKKELEKIAGELREAEITNQPFNFNEVYKSIKKYQNGDDNDPEFRDDLFNIFIYRIELDKSGINVFLNIQDEKKQPSPKKKLHCFTMVHPYFRYATIYV